jgi:superfamily II DNA helicase RecQ
MQQYRIFKLGIAETSCERLNAFLRQNTVIAVEKRFVEAGDESFYAVLVEYDAQTPETKFDRGDRVDYAKILDEHQFVCFNELREYRAKAAKEQGLPPYVVFTNDMAMKMVRLAEPNKAALAGIEGFGESKMGKYGDTIMEILCRHHANRVAGEKKS